MMAVVHLEDGNNSSGKDDFPDTETEKGISLSRPAPKVEYKISEARQKQVIRRIDVRLLPILGVMYSMSLVDRTNLGLAAIAGLNSDLGLNIGDRYTVIVMLFFVAYITFEIPSNIILPRAGPANWLSFLGVSFGAILIGMGFTQSWNTLALCRFLLGTFEAGFLPGCTYLITCWYQRFEVGKRLAGFWILSVIVSGFSAIFAYALTLLRGQAGLNGWRWIFIIEGIITVLICAVGWFIIVDFPTKAKFLTPEEKQFVIDRINNDRGDAVEDKVDFKTIIFHLRDFKLYIWAINIMASAFTGYAYSYFLPQILHGGMGFTVSKAQLLTAPPHALGAILTFTSGWLSDKYKIRGPLIAIHQLIVVAGMLITAYSTNNAAKYFGAFLGVGFTQYCVPGVLTYQANNITSHSKRAVGSATTLIGGGIGGILASVAFKTSESPTFETGVWTAFAVSLCSVLLIVGLDLYFWRCNKRAKKGESINEGMADWYYTY